MFDVTTDLAPSAGVAAIHQTTARRPVSSIPHPVLRRRFDAYRTRAAAHQGRYIMAGKTVTADDVAFTSNDYLSIATHPAVIDAGVSAMRRFGSGAMMSAIFVQDCDNPQRILERQLAQDLGAEEAILTQSGWCANVGLLQSIADETTPVYIDFYAHMSLWEGIKSAGARAVPVHHNDLEHLEAQILRYGPGVIAIDAIYSTTGSLAPVAGYAEIARRLGCILIVDESHSLGTHGPNGEGLVKALGLNDSVHFVTASLAKAYAGRAGIVTCARSIKEYLFSTSLPAIFSSTLLPHDLSMLCAAHAVVRSESWRRDRLRATTQRVRAALLQSGYPIGNGSEQILGLEAGLEIDTMHVRDVCEKHGIIGSIFCAPATPMKRSLLRLTLTAGHSDEQIDRLISTLARIHDELRVSSWSASRRNGRRFGDGSILGRPSVAARFGVRDESADRDSLVA